MENLDKEQIIIQSVCISFHCSNYLEHDVVCNTTAIKVKKKKHTMKIDL